MPTNAELQTKIKNLDKELQQNKEMLHSFELVVRRCQAGLHLTWDDLERSLIPTTQYEEAGSEQAERYTQCIKLTNERLHAIYQALDQPSDLSLLDTFRWKPTPTEDEEYVAQIISEGTNNKE